MSSSALERSPSALAARWKHGAIPVIGLIGGIGSGKSRVAAMLDERGAMVIDADKVGHEVLEQAEVAQEVVKRFGHCVRRTGASDATGELSIDRRALGEIVFADSVALRDLEAILHPSMERQFEQRIVQAVRADAAPVIVLDAAILLEAGWDRLCDLVVFVEAPWAVRLQRVASSRGWTAEMLEAREAAQWPADSKRCRADVILRNDTTVESLEQSVDRLLASLSGRGALDYLARAPGGRQAGHWTSRRPIPAVPGESL
jgi:dephospho-CoA kinase